MLDFLNGNEFFDEDDPKILNDFVDQLNAESKSINFTVPGTVSTYKYCSKCSNPAIGISSYENNLGTMAPCP